MLRSSIRFSVPILFVAAVFMTARAGAINPRIDFGSFVQQQLGDHSEELFGFRRPLAKSAFGPYTGADNTQSIQVADGLHVRTGGKSRRVRTEAAERTEKTHNEVTERRRRTKKTVRFRSFSERFRAGRHSDR